MNSFHLKKNTSYIEKEGLSHLTTQATFTWKGKSQAQTRLPLNFPITPKSLLHGLVAVGGGEHLLLVRIEENVLDIFMEGKKNTFRLSH